MTAPTIVAAGTVPGRPARPGGDVWWERVERVAATCPPLSEEQRAAIRVAIWGARRPGKAAA